MNEKPAEMPAEMMEEITCPMCGHRFRPRQQGMCAQCPLNGSCRLLTCCPRCGYEVVNPAGSWLARRLKRWLPNPQPNPQTTPAQQEESNHP